MKITSNVEQLSAALKTNQLYIVGGAVRDYCLGKESKDIDLATDLTPSEIIEQLSDTGIHALEIGMRRGTVVAIVNNEQFEITTFRQYVDEKQYSKTIEEDLSARDLSINAIAFNVKTNEFVDPHGGIEDIKNKVIKSVGFSSGKRFSEDPLRMIRAIRFKNNLGFEYSTSITSALYQYSNLLVHISRERIGAEFLKIMSFKSGANLVASLSDMLEFDIIKHIHPTLFPDINESHFKKNIIGICSTRASIYQRFAELLNDLDNEQIKKFLSNLKYSSDLIKEVQIRVVNNKFLIDSDAKAREFLIKNNFSSELINDYISHIKVFHPNAILALRKRFIDQMAVARSIATLAINGNDIIEEFKIKPGPDIRLLLDKCRYYTIENPEYNNRDSLIEFLK